MDSTEGFYASACHAPHSDSYLPSNPAQRRNIRRPPPGPIRQYNDAELQRRNMYRDQESPNQNADNSAGSTPTREEFISSSAAMMEFLSVMGMIPQNSSGSNPKRKILNGDLIDLSGEVSDLILVEETEDKLDPALLPMPRDSDREKDEDDCRLPRHAIIFDYTLQPIGMREQNREYLPAFLASSSRFLRPIILDGIGLVKAYRNCCPSLSDGFPLVPVVRCLFYWISRGHYTILSFPSNFNPLNSIEFKATPEHCSTLRQLKKWKMVFVFRTESETNKQWFSKVLENNRACLITTVTQWRMAMPNELSAGVITNTSNLGNYHRPSNISYEQSPERLLQPFFSHDGEIVFFSSFSSTGHFVAEIILDEYVIPTREDFDSLSSKQLKFIDQCKQLKLLYHQLPPGMSKRIRETTVMVKLLEKLEPFLP
ncbi:hypothetical protein DdX_08046 [Ditylenchus destructor]|uniref:Uncharacterized protein n=1 Tax=Ditylenchus destructor TaxID=166010 RepID=A0AAD4N427_9BILA|nr:hypothetical protein DdX_08046 [Ditylenchus destructor]